MQRYIHERMLRDFLDSRFTGEDEQFWFHGGRLTDDAMASLRRALQVAARECAAVVDADRRSGSPRSGAAFVIALRRWAFSGFEPFER